MRIIIFVLTMVCFSYSVFAGARLTPLNRDLNEAQINTANEIFSRLLLYWTHARIEPRLTIEKKGEEIWARSLPDGNIVLTQGALQVSLQKRKGLSGESALAFVLAHELAHQISDDLWGIRYFEDTHHVNLSEKERKADAKALVLMSLAGYDPLSIIGKDDFFTFWTLKRWGFDCQKEQQKAACKESLKRVQNNRELLRRISKSLVLFQLGNYALVAGQYASAQAYFHQFAHYFPSHSVFNNLATSYLLETLQIFQQLVEMGESDFLIWLVPVMDHTIPVLEKVRLTGPTRDGKSIKEKKQILLKKIDKKLNAAIDHLTKAIDMNPNGRNTHVNLIFAYILKNQTALAQGYIQDRFIPLFGKGASPDSLLTLAKVKKKPHAAYKILRKTIRRYEKEFSGLNQDDKNSLFLLLVNLDRHEKFFRKSSTTKKYWLSFARQSQASDTFNFSVSRNQLHEHQSKGHKFALPGKFSIGQEIKQGLECLGSHKGVVRGMPKLKLCQYGQQHMVLDNKNKLVAIWGKSMTPNMRVSSLLHRYGLPNRQLFTAESAQYWAYDELKIGFYLHGDKVRAWFKYPSP